MMHLKGPLAERDSWEASGCSIAKAIDLVGTRSAILILREAFYGATRFDQFSRRVGISDAVASARLRELTEAGIFTKVPYRDAGQRERFEYQLTDMGRDLFPVVMSLMQWGNDHLQPTARRSEPPTEPRRPYAWASSPNPPRFSHPRTSRCESPDPAAESVPAERSR